MDPNKIDADDLIELLWLFHDSRDEIDHNDNARVGHLIQAAGGEYLPAAIQTNERAKVHSRVNAEFKRDRLWAQALAVSIWRALPQHVRDDYQRAHRSDNRIRDMERELRQTKDQLLDLQRNGGQPAPSTQASPTRSARM